MSRSRTPKRDPHLVHYLAEPTVILFGCRPYQPYHADKAQYDEHGNWPFHASESAGSPPLAYDTWPTDHRCPACKGLIGLRFFPRAEDGSGEELPTDAIVAQKTAAGVWAHVRENTWCGWCQTAGRCNDRNAERLAKRAVAKEVAQAREEIAVQEAEGYREDLDRIGQVKRDAIVEEIPTLDYVTEDAGWKGYRRVKRVEGMRKVTRRPATSSIVLSESQRRRIWAGCLGDGRSTHADIYSRAKIGREWLEEIGQLPDFHLVLDRRGNVIDRLDTPRIPPGSLAIEDELPTHELIPGPRGTADDEADGIEDGVAILRPSTLAD